MNKEESTYDFYGRQERGANISDEDIYNEGLASAKRGYPINNYPLYLNHRQRKIFYQGFMKNSTIFSSNSPDKYDFEINKIKDSAKIVRSLNNKVRWSILKLLNENEELTVSQIYQTLKIYQEVASTHLKILKTSGAVVSRRNGKFIYYRINHSRISALLDKFEEIKNLTK